MSSFFGWETNLLSAIKRTKLMSRYNINPLEDKEVYKKLLQLKQQEIVIIPK